MSSIAFTIRIREGMEEEYKRRHEQIWPDVADALKKHGFRNYSIFMINQTLFAYVENDGDIEKSFESLHLEPAQIRWREYMSDIIIRDENRGFQFLERVFYFSG